MDKNITLARRIREFEIKVLDEFKKGTVIGTIHPSIGQELHQVRIIKQLKKDDVITSNHRGHGHFLAYTEDFKGLFDELCGLPSGVNNGKALSQHLHKNNFYSTGIQGGLLPMACGIAWSFKLQEKDNIVVSFIGDGTLGQGVLYECLNIASLWELPVAFIVENNQYAMSTPANCNITGDIDKRFDSFGLKKADEYNIRRNTPSYLIIDTYRFCGHSGNDAERYRSKEEKREWLKKDGLGGYLLERFL